MEPETQNNELADITIQDLVFKAPQPYGAGHVLKENEASALNQTFLENLRNNFAAKVRAAREAVAKSLGVKVDEVKNDQLDKTALDDDFSKYAAEYEFGTRKGGRILDPIEREMRDIAEEIVKAALRSKNIKLNSVSPQQMDQYIQGAIAKRPAIREEAERRVAATSAAAEIELGDLIGGGVTDAATGTSEEAAA